MDAKKLDLWASRLLDTGKKNNLVNFRDTKASTVEIVMPSPEVLFAKVESATIFEVFDPHIVDEDDEDYRDDVSDGINTGENKYDIKKEKLNRKEYIDTYGPRVKKNSQILLHNSNINPINVLKNIDKKAREHLEETGVNVAYIAFGFIHWKEREDSAYVYKAPILLAPVTFSNDSAIAPWFIKMTEDDVIVNPTFSFKLNAEHGMRLPEYKDEGLDEYIARVEKQVKKIGWTVTKECKIGIFSFLKMNMYKDLKDHQKVILQNNNVRMILGESFKINKEVSIEKGEHHLDNPLVELHNVVDADSSQIEAIEMAKAGVSFVLQGPPGTGKSQTITNIIAECLYDGKKVLFVSEKQAALNVVYDKLKKAGLEEFCLELHSYKSNKKDVIENLCKTLRSAKTSVSSQAKEAIESKIESQKELDIYEKELHKQRDVIHKSLYQLYDAYSANRNAPDVKLAIRDIDNKGDEYLRNVLKLLGQYVNFVPSIGYCYKSNSWYGYVNQDTSYQMREDIKTCLIDMSDALKEYIELSNTIEEKYGICCDSLKQTELWDDFFKLAAESQILTPSFLKQSACAYLQEKLTEMEALSEEIIPVRDDISHLYDSNIYELDSSDAYNRLTRVYTSGFGRLFNSGYKKLIADIRINKKNGKKPSYQEAINLMEQLNLFHEKQAEFSEIENPLKQSLGSAYNGVDSDWNLMFKQISSLKELFDSGASFCKLEMFSNIDYEENKSEFAAIAEKIDKLKAKSSHPVEILVKSFDNDILDVENISFEKLFTKVKACLADYEKLDNWCGFRSLLHQLNEHQLIEFIDAAIDANIQADEIVTAYQKNYYGQWIDYVQHLSPVLSTFNRVLHDQQVEIFSREDSTQFAISKVQIRSKLSKNRPSLDFVSPGSAVSILLRESEKKRKQKSIRNLMEEAGELIQVIKPCFLMSPLSVSTFLDADVRFDTVVFDEASQIFPQDAIGAIYRGKQLIVVGDSKQMPPSNFFTSSVELDDNDENTGDITNFESILDLCSTAMAQIRLRWHYRSRYEPLITFSNQNFYDNDLVTFPSAVMDRKWIGVDYHCVEDGIFDHKSRNNRKEAEYIVDLIFKNIELFPERSLGVVAFSVSQQDLIDKLLSRRRMEDPSKEFFFRRDAAEPFFIKNLETVQGDERDTIIFSVAYAKDSTGRLMHNFGPLNRMGGERRLNVAVTRAKLNVQLVASIHYTDIDLGRTKAEGARLLRTYLDYAENGVVAIERAITVNPFEQFDSEFEMEVCEFLRDKGYEVDTQVGCSNFRIDLGIKRAGTSDYVLAVECDGATYHSSKNARDRDRLRQSILENMGWKFYRIWSTDWFKNTAVEKERLLEAVKEAINDDSIKTQNSNIDSKLDDLSEEQYEETVKESHILFPVYVEADLYKLSRENSQFLEFIKSVLEIEAPISEEWLLRRIPWMFGREKVTKVVKEEYERRMRYCDTTGIVRKNGFLYLKNQLNYMLRIPEEYGEKRDINYICREELGNGLYEIIKQNVSIEKDSLYKYLANLLGINRITDKVICKMDDSLNAIKKFIEINGSTISAKKMDKN